MGASFKNEEDLAGSTVCVFHRTLTEQSRKESFSSSSTPKLRPFRFVLDAQENEEDSMAGSYDTAEEFSDPGEISSVDDDETVDGDQSPWSSALRWLGFGL